MKKFLNPFLLLDIFIIFIILVLPYLFFNGKLYLGGDDTRLLYIFPKEYLYNFGFFSWLNYSSSGTNAPWQFLFPFLSVWYLVSKIITNQVMLDYLSFSLPLIFGFIYMKKLILVITHEKKNKFESTLGSVFYIASPIIAMSQLFIFLSTAWLIALIPILFYYYISYLKTGKFLNVFKAVIAAILLSLAFFSIPWILGTLFPLILGVLVILPLSWKRTNIIQVKQTFIYGIVIFLSQQFWFIPFISTYILKTQNDFGTKVLSKDFLDTFTPTVLATATGNIFYPLANLYHRQIAFDYEWHLKQVFSIYYDQFLIINVIFIFIIILGIRKFVNYNFSEKIIFLRLFAAFLISLALFTVNIGPFREIFIKFGLFIPGFAMFRNFYDKFAVGYAIIYALLIAVTIVQLKKYLSPTLYKIVIIFFTIAVLVNVIPTKNLLNAPVWQTKDVYRNINFPEEFITFTGKIKTNISPTSNIFNVPMSSSIYSIIKEDSTNSVYLGASPLKLLTGVNNYNGNMSFNYGVYSPLVDQMILNKDYDDLSDYLYERNINYLLYTKNIPDELYKAKWIFIPGITDAANKEFIKTIALKKEFESENKNYIIYSTKKQNIALKGENILFTKINPVRYKVYISHLSKSEFIFNDSFHGGWNLYPQKNPNKKWCTKIINKKYTSAECITSKNLLVDLVFNSFASKPFENSQKISNKYSNIWTLDQNTIKENFNNDYYIQNKDGTIDVEFDLYFQNQVYFYIGFLVSLLMFIICLIYLIYEKNNNK